MITKGVILAGGKGTRLMPLTLITNKELLAVYDRPMIEFPLATLQQAGCKEIMIVCNKEFGGDFIRYLGSGHDRGLTITYRVQDYAGGIAHALSLARDFTGPEQFFLTFGDQYFETAVNIPALPDTEALITVMDVKDPHRFGIAEIHNNTLVSVEEKPKHPKSNTALIGFYVFPPEVYQIIDTLKPSGRGELEITDAVDVFLKKGRLQYARYNGVWMDMGTPESLARTVVRRVELLNGKDSK